MHLTMKEEVGTGSFVLVRVSTIRSIRAGNTLGAVKYLTQLLAAMDAICGFPNVEVRTLPCRGSLTLLSVPCPASTVAGAASQIGNLNELLGNLYAERAGSAPVGLHAHAKKQVLPSLPFSQQPIGKAVLRKGEAIQLHRHMSVPTQAREARMRALSMYAICLGDSHERFTDLSARMRLMR